MLGECPDFVVSIFKGYPEVVCSLLPPRFSNPNWIKPWQQGLSPELSALSRIWDWTFPELPHHLWLLALAQVTPIPHSDGATLTSIYSFDTFLLTPQGLPGAWYNTCDCAWIKQKTPFSCCQSFPTTFPSTKAFHLDFARFNTLFEKWFWLLTAQYLPPACLPGFGNSLLVHIKSVLWTAHLETPLLKLYFFQPECLQMSKEMIKTLISVVRSQLSTLFRGILTLHTAQLAGEYQER